MGISRDSKHKRRASGGRRKIHRKKRKFELGRPPALTKLGPQRIHPVRCRGGSIKYRALRLETGNFSWPSEAVTRKTRVLGVVYNASNNELVRTNTLVKSAIIQIDAAPFRQWYEQHYGINLGKNKGTKAKVADAKKGDAKKTDAKKDAKKGDAKKTDAKKADAKKADKPADAKKADKPADAKKADKPAGEKKADDKKAKKPADAKKGDKSTDDKKKVVPGTLELTESKKRKIVARKKTRLEPTQSILDQFTAGRLYAAVTSRPGQCGRCDGYILEGEELAFYLKKLQKKKGKQQQ